MPQTFSRASLIRDFLCAAGFLTVLPVAPKETNLARAMFFFPLVGLLIAGISFALYLLASPFFAQPVSVLVMLATPILLSGALHLDGFADFCDGFFGGKTKEEALRIMKDPTIGSFGAAGLILLLLAKFQLILTLPDLRYYLLALGASRWMQVVLAFSLPYIGKSGGLGESIGGKVRWREVAGGLWLVPLLGFLGMKGLFVMAGALILLGFFGLAVKRKLGGVTGDVIGAASELSELAILCFACAGASHV